VSDPAHGFKYGYRGRKVSPSEELGRTMEVVTKNMEEMEASA
jgi:hypothetical protein